MFDRKLLTVVPLCIALILIAFPATAQHRGKKTDDYPYMQGMRGQAGAELNQGWYCPMCGMSEGPKRAMGYDRTPLDKKQAEFIVNNYLRQDGNPNLMLGEVSEQDDHFIAEITTKDGSLADKIQVHKMTGFIRSVYDIPKKQKETTR